MNRALARELYVDSTVHVVNPTSRRKSDKVKPGQMNLFNPKGQKLDSHIAFTETVNGSKVFSSPGRSRKIDQIHEIYNIRDENGEIPIQNEEIRKKNDAVQ